MTDIPWNDAAVLLQPTPGASDELGHAIQDEGTLREIVQRLALRRGKLPMLKISLPDRRTPPYEFHDFAIPVLLTAYRRNEEAELAAKGTTDV